MELEEISKIFSVKDILHRYGSGLSFYKYG